MDKIGKFKFDTKSFRDNLNTIRSSRKAFETIVHKAAVQTVLQAIVYKNANAATQLVSALGGISGVTLIRSNAVKEWLVEQAPVVWKDDGFKLAPKDRYAAIKAQFDADPEAFVQLLLDTTIQETKPEKKYKDFNLLEHLIKQVTAMKDTSESMLARKEAGMVVDLSDKQAILDALIAIQAKKIVRNVQRPQANGVTSRDVTPLVIEGIATRIN